MSAFGGADRRKEKPQLVSEALIITIMNERPLLGVLT
jgi:hypothetical protein